MVLLFVCYYFIARHVGPSYDRFLSAGQYWVLLELCCRSSSPRVWSSSFPLSLSEAWCLACCGVYLPSWTGWRWVATCLRSVQRAAKLQSVQLLCNGQQNCRERVKGEQYLVCDRQKRRVEFKFELASDARLLKMLPLIPFASLSPLCDTSNDSPNKSLGVCLFVSEQMHGGFTHMTSVVAVIDSGR